MTWTINRHNARTGIVTRCRWRNGKPVVIHDEATADDLMDRLNEATQASATKTGNVYIAVPLADQHKE